MRITTTSITTAPVRKEIPIIKSTLPGCSGDASGACTTVGSVAVVAGWVASVVGATVTAVVSSTTCSWGKAVCA